RTLCTAIAQLARKLRGNFVRARKSRSVWSAESLLPLSNAQGHRKREQALRTPYASRSSVAVSSLCAFRASAVEFAHLFIGGSAAPGLSVMPPQHGYAAYCPPVTIWIICCVASLISAASDGSDFATW